MALNPDTPHPINPVIQTGENISANVAYAKA